MRVRLRQAAPRLAALALLALAVLLAVGPFVHTDDGCAVERHCLACRFALNTAEGTATIAAAPPTLGLSEDARPAPAGHPEAGPAVVVATRGPPAA